MKWDRDGGGVEAVTRVEALFALATKVDIVRECYFGFSMDHMTTLAKSYKSGATLCHVVRSERRKGREGAQ